MTSTLRQHATAIAAWIEDSPKLDDARFNSLALKLFAFQFEHNPAYRRFCDTLGRDSDRVKVWQDIPAVPTAAFKELKLTVLPSAERTTVFHSSGTTAQLPSRHFHCSESLAVYEASLLAWAEPHLRLNALPVGQLLFLTPSPALAARSSLVHMLATIQNAHPMMPASFFGNVDETGAWSLGFDKLVRALSDAIARSQPVALFGTAFNFVHLLDELAARALRFELPPGSRVMETGGYKGRSRIVAKTELHAALTNALGVRPEFIVTEYGMSELSSQAYDAMAGMAAPRILRFPAWVPTQVISPETGREVPLGGIGLLRVFDLANVASVLAVQTEDLAVRHADGFELIGRSAASEPRGCSLMTA